MPGIRRKVLFILPTLRGGGAERVVLDLLRFLDRHRFDPTLLLFKREGAYWSEVPRDLRVDVLVGAEERLRQHPLRVLAQVLRHAIRSDVIVGALELQPTYVAYGAGVISRRPVVGWVHTSLGAYLDARAPQHCRWARWVYPRLDLVVCPSRGAADSLVALPSSKVNRVRVIPNLIDRDRVERMAAEPLPAWTDSVLRKPTVVASGLLHRLKGFDLLVRAHATLREQHLDHDLVILGEGPERKSLEALAGELGVQKSVRLPGFLSNPYPVVRRGTVFALPSRLEGFSLALLEAMYLGVPVVAANCASGPGEVLDGGRYGVLVPPDDPTQLAEGLLKLLSDRDFRERLAVAARRRAEEYLPDRVVPVWERLLDEVAG